MSEPKSTIDVSYFSKELDALKASLIYRTPEELYRYLIRLAAVVSPVTNSLAAENAELKEECRQQDMQSLKDCYREKDKECEALKAKVAELGELLNKQLQYNDFMTSNMINALKFENARMREMVRRIDDDAEETIIDSYKRTEKQAHNDLRRFAKAIRQRCEQALKDGE